MLLKQSTAQTVVIGPILDADGVAVTTAVIGNISIAKNGTAAALTTETLTHLANGYYTLALTSSNTNTLGILAAYVNNTAMSMTVFRWNVIVASAYDAIVNNATNATGGLLTATGSVSAIAGALLNTTNLPTNFASFAITGGGAVTVGTNNDKTGYALTQTFPSNFSSLAITVGGAVTVGTNNDKTGYALTQSFPSNFASMNLDVSGRVLLQPTQTGVTIPTVTSVTNAVTAGTVSDKTGYSLVAGTGLGNQTANITGNLSGSVGSVTGNVGGNVVGSVGSVSGITFPTNFDKTSIDANGHVTSKVDSINNNAITASSIQANAITAAKIATGAFTAQAFAVDSITASALASDAVTEIQSGLASQSSVNTLTSYVDTEVAAIKAKTDQLSFTVANQVDANALSGGGGGGSIVVTPVVAQTPVRAVATTITTYKGDRSAITVGVFSGTTPVNLSTLGALEICIQTKAGTDLQLISAANITISGTSSNYFSFSPNATAVGTVGRFMWSLRVASSSSKQVIVYGAFVVEDAALAD